MFYIMNCPFSTHKPFKPLHVPYQCVNINKNESDPHEMNAQNTPTTISYTRSSCDKGPPSPLPSVSPSLSSSRSPPCALFCKRRGSSTLGGPSATTDFSPVLSLGGTVVGSCTGGGGGKVSVRIPISGGILG